MYTTCFPLTILFKAKECTQCVVFIRYAFEIQQERSVKNENRNCSTNPRATYGIVLAYTELFC